MVRPLAVEDLSDDDKAFEPVTKKLKNSKGEEKNVKDLKFGKTEAELVALKNPSKDKEEKKPDIRDVLKKRKLTGGSGTKIEFVSAKARDQNRAKEDKQREAEMRKKAEEFYLRRKEFLMEEETLRERQRQREREEREAERLRLAEEKRKQREEEERLKEEERKAGKKESALGDLNLLNLDPNEHRQRIAERELEVIRKHYLGMKDEKRKLQKPSEKFRNIFNFEWDATEDTCRHDSNPLYTQRHEPQLLFGRGYRAGIDVREQRRTNNFYEKLVEKRMEGNDGEISNFVMPAKEGASTKYRDIETFDQNPGDKYHWSEKQLDDMTDRDWRIFREDFEIYLKGGRVPAPMRTWAEGPLSWELLEAIRKVGYERPTPIQMQAIPVACLNRDLIGIAETGSGKTAAFMLPMLQYVGKLPPINEDTAADGPYGLVLAPSRELAVQIEEEAKKFAQLYTNCKVVSVVGGRFAEAQAFELRKGCEICIATPGRMAEALDKSYTVLHQCNYVVMDECDRILDLGFESFVDNILGAIPTTNMKSENEDEVVKQELEAKAGHRTYRITQMFSATMPTAVERLARRYLRSPAYISIGDPGAGKKAIEQRIEFIEESHKKKRLEDLLATAEPPVIVFSNAKKAVDVLGKALDQQGYRVTTLHSGKAQDIREANMAAFKEGKFDILVATDLAGRGIDVEGVTQVINFDMPKSIENYTHRIGRTGRAGKKGLATSFVTMADDDIFYDLRNILTSTNNIVPYELDRHPKSRVKPGEFHDGPAAGKVVFSKGT